MKKFTFLLVALLAFTVQSYGQFPNPYCTPTPFTYVEPITLVNFAGINNPSPAATTGIPHEDFTTIVANVDTGTSYPITIKGNTGGNWTNYIRVYFDWNQDNDFLDAGESYDLGTIVNSTGLDATQLSSTITVPASALAGSTRMRVVKAYAGYADSCNTSSALFGQVEDYSVMVVIPTCVAPSNGMADVTSHTTADLTWTSAVTEGEIVVQEASAGTPATAPGTGETFTGGTSYEATGLTAFTAYEFYVRNECTSGEFSSWAGPFAFHTTLIPGCPTNPTPANGAIDVPVGNVTFSWTAPTTGDPVVSYDLYYGLTQGEANIFVASFTETTAELTLTGFDTDFYWVIVPVNAGGSPVGCTEWSFTTVSPPPVPDNDACADAIAITTLPYTNTQDATSATNNAGFINACTIGGGGSNDGVWYTVVGNGMDLTVSVEDVIGWDPQLDIYTGTCGSFTCVAAVDSSGADGGESFVIESSVAGTTYYINVGHYSGFTNTAEGPFTISVISATTDTPDYVSLQAPIAQTIEQLGSIDVYGQIYEAGLTDVAPNIDGMAPGIEAWVGISPEGENSDPATWTTWIEATHNPAHISNNDEYTATIGADLDPGTYYYATRFRLNNGMMVYGGVDADGNGNFWNGTTHLSGVLTVNVPPAPANDECSGAIAITMDEDVCDGTTNNGTNFGATDSGVAVPDCFNYGQNDVWFSFVVPAGVATVDVSTDFTGGTLVDTEIALYSGVCGSLTEMNCDNDSGTTVLSNGSSWNSLITDAAVTVGETYYVRVSGYSAANIGTFCLKVSTNTTLGTSEYDRNSLAVYPNPVKDVMKFSYSENITEVAIFNLLGQKVIVEAINGTDGQVDMSQLASGAYIVKVSAGNDTKSIKVIKE